MGTDDPKVVMIYESEDCNASKEMLPVVKSLMAQYSDKVRFLGISHQEIDALEEEQEDVLKDDNYYAMLVEFDPLFNPTEPVGDGNEAFEYNPTFLFIDHGETVARCDGVQLARNTFKE